MPTSEASTATTTSAGRERVALRLNLVAAEIGRGAFDGVWWPQGRDLETEVAELADHFPETYGHIERLEYSAPHWDLAGREIEAAHGNIEATVARRDDPHIVVLTLSSGRTVRLLVLPPATPDADARLIMDRTASAVGLGDDGSGSSEPRPTAGDEQAGEERWVDDGDAFWDPDPVPPSERG